MGQLRIFSYLPNPRIWKATITARLSGVDLEIRGSSPKSFSRGYGTSMHVRYQERRSRYPRRCEGA
jgi:hypothetical protein